VPIAAAVPARLRRAQPWLSTVARLGLAAVLIASGWLKLIDPDGSVRAVRAYRLLPETLARGVGFGLPVLELALAVLLLLGLGTRVAAAVFAALLVVFIIGVASVWARGLSIDCGCFGGGGTVAAGRTNYPWEIARDVGLLAVALLLAAYPRNRWSLDGALGLSEPIEPAPADQRAGEGAGSRAGGPRSVR
jgi:uncharacterized membrane protein YphA (DoxX/SURF4 family)